MKKIPLTQGKFALIDDEDFELVSKFKWCISHPERNNPYAMTNVLKEYQKILGRKMFSMHWLIMGGLWVDHINGNGLDNRKSNLRFANHSQNNMNRKKSKGKSSKKHGVYWDRDRSNWVAQIKKHGKVTYIGSFKTEKDAAIARDLKAEKMFKDFAKLNYA